MPPESADLLIEARWVLPIAPANTVLAEHAVAVCAGKIVAVGPAVQMRERFESRERVVRAHHALLPGFINAHTCVGTRLLRGLPAGRSVETRRGGSLGGVEDYLGAGFARDSARLAVAEMLRAGITAFADRSLFPEETARIAGSTRMRAAIGLPVSDSPGPAGRSATDHLGRAERLWDEYQSDAWISPYFAPRSVSISDDALMRVRRVVDELDARVAMPVHASAQEVSESLSRHGRRPLRRLGDLGLLRPGFTAIHMCALEPQDLETAEMSGVCVVACPQSDLRLGSGRCPTKQLAARHTSLGLGTADPLAGGALDLLAEGRTAALLAGIETAGADLPAQDVLYMLTLGGAAALGLSAQVGSIEPDKAADLICLDLSLPGCGPVSNPADSIIFGATRSHVSDVWISGRSAVSAGQPLLFDAEELTALEEQWMHRIQRGAHQ